MHNRILGGQGEGFAVEWLKWHNYEILETNWRSGKQEIDIIGRTASHLVFFEVKTRGSEWFGNPESAVDHKKQKFMMQAAAAYMEANGYEGPFRFDIISIVIEPHVRKLLHSPDAFFPLTSS